MNRKEELESIIAAARDELSDIQDKERVMENEKYIGKFFKYRNSYSCPEENEYWWLYASVTGVNNHGNITSWNFQKDIYGKIEIERMGVFYPDHGYQEITEEEFLKAYAGIITEVAIFPKQ